MPVKLRIKSVKIGDGEPTCIMGVVNCSPESFYPPSVKLTPRDLAKYTLNLVEDGVDIIDVGAASTAPPSLYPAAKYISEEEELNRIESAIPIIRDCTSLPISVDTMRARVAERALRLGADIINDVSGLKKDKKMLKVISDYSPYLILMASMKEAGDVNSINEMVLSLKESLKLAVEARADKSKIIIDPGFGFGKSADLNIRILKNIRTLKVFRKPILVGLSRKAFIKKIIGSDQDADILTGSLIATTIAVLKGAHIIRVHDVKEAKILSKFISKYNLID